MLSAFLFAAALGSVSLLDSAEHSPQNYTQGLFFDGGSLYETAGEYGKSRLFRYPAPGISPTDSTRLESAYFGEGSVKVGRDIFWLTWREGVVFIFDAKTFVRKGQFPIQTEGWGLCLYNGSLLMSDGSEYLHFLSLGEKRVFQKVAVSDGGAPVRFLNELECVRGVVYANVWNSDSIAAIDPKSGNVLMWYDFSKIAAQVRRKNSRAEVLNGIAFDGKDFWITGKFWPVMYKVRLETPPIPAR